MYVSIDGGRNNASHWCQDCQGLSGFLSAEFTLMIGNCKLSRWDLLKYNLDGSLQC